MWLRSELCRNAHSIPKPNGLGTSAGRRQCVIVGGQTQDDETLILYKVLEYKTEAAIKFSIGNLIGAPAAVNYIPIHPSRISHMTEKNQTQLSGGISNVTERIERAIGQAVPKIQ